MSPWHALHHFCGLSLHNFELLSSLVALAWPADQQRLVSRSLVRLSLVVCLPPYLHLLLLTRIVFGGRDQALGRVVVLLLNPIRVQI